MSIDLNRLTPAPWRYHAVSDRMYTVDGPGGHVVALPPWWGESCKADLEFIALARNAFAVMMRRGWTPTYEPGLGWRLLIYFADHNAEFAEWVLRHYFADPFTAIVEADEWYKLNVEKQ